MSMAATLPKRHRRAALGDDRQVAQVLDRVAQLARIAHVDRKALQAFDRLADVLAADRGRDDALHVRDVEAVARRGADQMDVDVAAARQALGEGGSGRRARS